MMRRPSNETEKLVDLLYGLEQQVFDIISRAGLTEEEKTFVLKHILIIPSKEDWNDGEGFDS